MTADALLHIDAIVLAAGAASRMGATKQLLGFSGGTLLSHAIAAAHAAGCRRTWVVLGAHAESIAATLNGTETVVLNSDWQQGLASSIRVGITACSAAPAADAALLVTCDQPLVQDLGPLVRVFRDQPQRIAAAAYADTVGVPAIFPRAFFSALEQLQGDTGARAVLRGNRAVVNAVALSGAAFDIDTPDDYARLLAQKS